MIYSTIRIDLDGQKDIQGPSLTSGDVGYGFILEFYKSGKLYDVTGYNILIWAKLKGLDSPIPDIGKVANGKGYYTIKPSMYVYGSETQLEITLTDNTGIHIVTKVLHCPVRSGFSAGQTIGEEDYSVLATSINQAQVATTNANNAADYANAKANEFDGHITNADIHVTAEKKTAWDNKINLSEKNTVNGIAGLDENGRISVSRLPNNLISDKTYEADWKTFEITYDPETGVFTTSAPHGLSIKNPVEFRAGTGVLPNGLSAYDSDTYGTYYNIHTVPSSTTFTITSTVEGTSDFVPTTTGTSGYQIRLAGINSNLTIDGLNLATDVKYQIELSNYGFAKLRTNGESSHVLANDNYGSYDVLGNYNGNIANDLLFESKSWQTQKYGVSVLSIYFDYFAPGLINFKSFHYAAITDSKSNATAMTGSMGGILKKADNLTSLVFRRLYSSGYYRNGIRVKVWRLN